MPRLSALHYGRTKDEADDPVPDFWRLRNEDWAQLEGASHEIEQNEEEEEQQEDEEEEGGRGRISARNPIFEKEPGFGNLPRLSVLDFERKIDKADGALDFPIRPKSGDAQGGGLTKLKGAES